MEIPNPNTVLKDNIGIRYFFLTKKRLLIDIKNYIIYNFPIGKIGLEQETA